jgi:hypothetical protein
MQYALYSVTYCVTYRLKSTSDPEVYLAAFKQNDTFNSSNMSSCLKNTWHNVHALLFNFFFNLKSYVCIRLTLWYRFCYAMIEMCVDVCKVFFPVVFIIMTNLALYYPCLYRCPSRVYFAFFSNANSVWHNPHLNAWDETDEALQSVTWRYVNIINDEQNAIQTYKLQCFNSLGRTCNCNYHLHQKLLTRHYSYCNRFDQCIARQRLRKYITTHNNWSCVSLEECYSSLLSSSQRPNELTV